MKADYVILAFSVQSERAFLQSPRPRASYAREKSKSAGGNMLYLIPLSASLTTLCKARWAHTLRSLGTIELVTTAVPSLITKVGNPTTEHLSVEKYPLR
jgi:hypothetical protein